MFAASDDIGDGSLDGILAGKLSTYRVVHLVTVGQVREAGFTLLPTFARPHFTLLLTSVDQAAPSLELLGQAQVNRHYGVMTGRRRR